MCFSFVRERSIRVSFLLLPFGMCDTKFYGIVQFSSELIFRVTKRMPVAGRTLCQFVHGLFQSENTVFYWLKLDQGVCYAQQCLSQNLILCI